ncbi:MAG: neutral/alkaline non-lysosomal ceramidase N-terminal domain-containing protein [Candidatus Saccharibacteria bacterium]|nr:neutral/alkaline non-lysosomal ceramidase N-terminal domain-containing protein [Moraxellaceae bacterium]
MYRAGWNKQEIPIKPQGYAMFGYGQWHHRAYGQQTPLYARALYIADSKDQALIFCCLDMGCITGAMRIGVCEQLRERMGKFFNESAFVLTATHTHSAPGGCSHEALYNVPTPGFVFEHLDAVVTASVEAILSAWETAESTELGLDQTKFADEVPVAWNRSLASYNRNFDVVQRHKSETHLALDRTMSLLSLRRNGELKSLLSLFGVHATCLSSHLNRHDGDNKGYASAKVEQSLAAGGVAIFAQATAGDVSPHYHGKGDLERRKKIKGEAEYVYAAQNGGYQSDIALAALSNKNEEQIFGKIDSIISFIDFTSIHAAPEFANGVSDAWTSEPCHGTAFFQGTPVDGPGTPEMLIGAVSTLAHSVKKLRLSPLMRNSKDTEYYRRLYASQGNKSILLEAGRKQILGCPMGGILPSMLDPLIGELKRQINVGAIKESPLVPTRIPLQIVMIGQLALVCCPGEFTTIAGRRVLETVKARLQNSGIKHVLICTYCNDYMGYVTTQEEYQQQAYEGGHTLFGQWTLAAFQTQFSKLADELLKPDAERKHDRMTRPVPIPQPELALRSGLAVPS